MSIDVELTNEIEVAKENGVEVERSTSAVPVSAVNNESIVEGYKKEYSIVGDSIYASVSAEDAPQWLLAIIDSVLGAALEGSLSDLTAARNNILTAISEIDVAKNQYQELINIEATVEGVVASRLATLNATVDGNSSNIVELDITKATPTEALAISVDHLSSELLDGSIRSEFTRVDTSVATLGFSTTSSIEILEADYEDLSTGLAGNASVITTTNSYVGLLGGIPDGTGLLADVEILQKQNDGVIETTTGTYDVMSASMDGNPDTTGLVTTAEPYTTWKAADDLSTTQEQRSIHVGDVYIKYGTDANGAKEYLGAYKFIKTVVDGTSPYATDTDGYTWALISDTDAQNAYVVALNASDLADQKRRVFVASPNVPYDVGDLWLVQATDTVVIGATLGGRVVEAGDVLRASTAKLITGVYSNGDWLPADNYKEYSEEVLGNFVSTIYEPEVSSIQTQIDAKIEYWYTASTSDPKGAWTTAELKLAHNGDVWYQTDTKISQYYVSTTNTWALIEDAKALEAIANAATAQATADGKTTTFYGTRATETGEAIGDVLVTSDEGNKQYRWSGTGWLDMQDTGIAANAGQITDIDLELTNGTTTWASADSSLTNTLNATIINGDAIVESKFAYDSTLNINGTYYKSGFGLDSVATSGTGTELDPFSSQFWIKAEELSIRDSSDVEYIGWDGSTLTVTGDIVGSTITGSTVTGGTITGTAITGGTIQTSATGERVALSDVGSRLTAYDSAGTLRVAIGTPYSDGTGTYSIFMDTDQLWGAKLAGGARPLTVISNSTTTTNPTGIFSRVFCNVSVSSAYAMYASVYPYAGSAVDNSYGVYATSPGYNHSANTIGGYFDAASATISSKGVVASGQTYDFYATGTGANYGPFTGAHDCLVPDSITINVGDIIVDKELYYARNVSNTLFIVEISSRYNQVAIGIIATEPSTMVPSAISSIAITTDGEGRESRAETTLLPSGYSTLQMNAVGEGMLNVCGEGGDISNGDLIVTSSTPGKGMRQADDIVRNYTVAKARGNHTFTSPDEIKMIPCIYLCG